MKNENLNVVLFSGGLDSTVMAWYVAKNYPHVPLVLLSLIYDSTQNIQEDSEADSIYRELQNQFPTQNISRKVHVVPTIRQMFSEDHPMFNPNMVPEEDYQKGTSPTSVAFRNGVFISLATMFAGVEVETHGFKEAHVYMAVHQGDRGPQEDVWSYPDCSVDFMFKMRQAVYSGSDEKVFLDYPFVQLEKSDIVELGAQLKAPLNQTYSCYKGGRQHCGVCATCRERRKAFRDADVTDLTFYERDINV